MTQKNGSTTTLPEGYRLAEDGEEGDCGGCSELTVADAKGGHTRTESDHDPRCQGDPSACYRYCPIPVPVHCGPVVVPS
jgi:hypothetical protein